MEKITILIADDHKLIRESWNLLCSDQKNFEVVGVCEYSDEAVESARIKRPDIVLMDINMLPFSGIEATEKILKISPGSKVIAVSMHSHPSYAKKMMHVGARGYVTKNSSTVEMINAIMEVYTGKIFICQEIKNKITDQVIDEDRTEINVDSVTHRELEIISFIKEGNSSKQIASSLNISLKTVEVHRHNILKKLKLKNSASLVNYINSSPYLNLPNITI